MKKKIKVLCLCSRGRNRSKYLAKYLGKKGYSTKFAGINTGIYWKPTKPITQEDVDWADVIIIARKRLLRRFKRRYKLKGGKLIILDVTDSKRLVPKESKHLRFLRRKDFNKKWTYPQLRKAIKPYLPLKR